MAINVDDADPRVSAMQPDWELIETLLGGTRAMRAAGEKYLPRWSLEDRDDYDARLKLATLFPATDETIRQLTGRVFGEEVGDDEMLSWIKDEVWPNMDMQDANGHVFARAWFRAGLAFGLAHVLVEAPLAPEVRTQADQRASGVRPYCILLTPGRVLGWRVGADNKLAQLRVTWSRTQPGDFGDEIVPQIRVYDAMPGAPVSVRTFEKVRTNDGRHQWALVEQVAMGVEAIPLATFYTGKTEPMCAIPPLRELAYLNAKHWAKQCSNDSLIDVASVPILCAIGINDEKTSIPIGAKAAVRISNPQGKLMFVEHSGQAIGAGRQSLQDLEAQMKAIGAKLIEPGAATKTATQAGEEAAQSNSVLAGWVRDFSDAMAALLDVIASYRGDAKGGRVTIHADLDPDTTPNESMQVLTKMVTARALSPRGLFEEGKRRGLISSEREWDNEQELIALDTPEPVTEPRAQEQAVV